MRCVRIDRRLPQMAWRLYEADTPEQSTHRHGDVQVNIVYRVEDDQGYGPFWGPRSRRLPHAANLPGPYEDFTEQQLRDTFHVEQTNWLREDVEECRFGIATFEQLMYWFGPDVQLLDGFYISAYYARHITYGGNQVLFRASTARRIWRVSCTPQLRMYEALPMEEFTV